MKFFLAYYLLGITAEIALLLFRREEAESVWGAVRSSVAANIRASDHPRVLMDGSAIGLLVIPSLWPVHAVRELKRILPSEPSSKP